MHENFTKSEEKVLWRLAYGRTLLNVFGPIESAISCTDEQALAVMKELVAVEEIGHRISEHVCNGGTKWDDERLFEAAMGGLKARVSKVLPRLEARKVHLNGDPRGCFLKLTEEYSSVLKREKCGNLYRDMGGQVVLCPRNLL